MKCLVGKPVVRRGQRVAAYDAVAEHYGIDPWRTAKVVRVLYEDDGWWVEVIFDDGGRQSILHPRGVRKMNKRTVGARPRSSTTCAALPPHARKRSRRPVPKSA